MVMVISDGRRVAFSGAYIKFLPLPLHVSEATIDPVRAEAHVFGTAIGVDAIVF